MGKLSKIVYHWTASTHQPNATDLEHYHFLVNKDGLIIKGKYTPEDNLNCNDGKYAQHCGGGNTGAIGIGLCGMFGFKDVNNVGNYPLTAKQMEASFKLGAELCKKYNIPITKDTVFTHYEFGLKHPNTSSRGKIDIIYMPCFSYIKKDKVGDFIRNKVLWYSKHI